MKSLLISGGTEIPAALREIVARGSTAIIERRPDDVNAEGSMDEADRVVFWATSGDSDLQALAKRFAHAEKRERREVVVFITPDPDLHVAGLSPNEVFVWPRDEDRLTMAFMTGA